jgi:serine/threonine protein kinase
MLTGLPPFYSPKREEMIERVKNMNVRYPAHISENARSLIDVLLDKNRETRLGAGTDGVDNIKSHPWFASVNWTGLYNKEITPPFIPLPRNDKDYTKTESVGKLIHGRKYLSTSFIY